MKALSMALLAGAALTSTLATADWDHRWENHFRRHFHGEHFECVAHPRHARDDLFFGYGHERFEAERRALEDCRYNTHSECFLHDCQEHR